MNNARESSTSERSTDSRPVLCFCNSNRAWGGGEKWHLETALYFASAGYRVILAAHGASPLFQAADDALRSAAATCSNLAGEGDAAVLAAPELPAGLSALAKNLALADWRQGNLSFLNPFKVAAFADFLRRNRVTHLILNLPADLKLAVPAARKAGGGIKLYYRRGSAIAVKPSRLNKLLYSSLTGVIANSEETARCVRESNVIAPERITVIYNGLSVQNFDAALCGLAPFPDHFTAGNPLIIGNAARLSRQKGQKYLLHMSAVLKARSFPHRLIICGEGELRRELEELAATLNLELSHDWQAWQDYQAGQSENNVAGPALCLAGFQADLAPFWRSIHLFVLSSIWEGFGYALAEAMLAERPLLAFNCNSMPELVRDGVNGALLAAPDEGESDADVGARLAKQVMRMAAQPGQMEKFGQAGRSFCLENFEQEISMNRLEKLLFQS